MLLMIYYMRLTIGSLIGVLSNNLSVWYIG